MRRTSSNVHHGAHVVETNVWEGRRPACGPPPTARSDPPATAHARRRRRGGAAARWSRRRATTPGPGRGDLPARRSKRSASASPSTTRTFGRPCVAPERRRPLRVPLDRHDFDAPPRQGVGAGATAGTDLDDQLAAGEGSLRDEGLGDVRKEEVLAETATSLVPGRPSATVGRGHGPSPRYPCPPVLPPTRRRRRHHPAGGRHDERFRSRRSARSSSRSTSDHSKGSVSFPLRSAPSARVMITKATVHSTAMVESLARNPASCWSSSGVIPTTFPSCEKDG